MAGIEERLRALEDRSAILDTLYSYGHALDYGDEERWLSLWDEGAELYWPRIGLIRGRDAFVAAFRGHTHAPEKFHKHFLAAPLIRVDGDTARVESYFARMDVDGDETFVYTFGRYCDVLVRGDDGRWRFGSRRPEVEGRHARARP